MLNPTKSSPTLPGSVKTYSIVLGKNIKVTKDAKSKSRIINFPFEFPDGTNGVAILCRVKDDEWQPDKSIKSITLEFA